MKAKVQCLFTLCAEHLCAQTYGSILCDPKRSSPSGTCRYVSCQEVLYLAFYFPHSGVCTPLNLRLHEDGASAEVFKIYVQL